MMRVMMGAAAAWCVGAGVAAAQEEKKEPAEVKVERAAPVEEPATETPKAERWWLWGENRPTEWTVQLEPGVWFSAFGGKFKVGGGSRFDVRSINADDPRFSPYGEAHIRGGRWQFSLSGFGHSGRETSASTEAFTAGALAVGIGDLVRSEVELAGGEARVGYRMWRWTVEEEGAAGPPAAEILVDLYGGARALDLSTEIGVGGTTVKDDAFAAHPLAGARFGIEIKDRFTVDFAVDAGAWPGGGRSSWAIDAVAGFSWRPWGNVGFQLGYRILRLNMEDGGQEFDGSLAGLMGMVVIRF